MSATSAPFGLRPAFHPSGLDRAQALAGGIVSGYASNIFKGQPVQYGTTANGGTIGFLAETQEQVLAFHAAGIANGGTTCEDPPGPRQGPFGPLHLAYLRDPAGNKICVLYRPPKPAN